FSQVACYNTYFIDKNELEKLESEVEQKEVVTVYGDCPTSETASSESEDEQRNAHIYQSPGLDGTLWAQAEGADDTATDAVAAADEETEAAEKDDGDDGDDESAREGCTKVPVSTANPVTVRTQNGETYRVTPFNFMMSEEQLVSPEYDLLLSLDDVEGGQVREFSKWKTAGLAAGVTGLTVGSLVAISILAPEAEGVGSQ
ncbi:MAG: hypothetical protein ACOCV2_07320, partial [Persicimonas sp.]